MIGTTKQITDQAGKKRKGITDALGRMIRVIEDPTGQNLSTDYVFDTLGNLRETIQGEQHRYFMHDSLGRLLYSKQPEQDANPAFTESDPITNNSQWSNKYLYDENGNITSTTDARNVTVTAHYDKYNRIIYRDYDDTTPDVKFYYDGEGLAANPGDCAKGQTTRVASSVSETRYTSFDDSCRLDKHEQITQGETYETEYTYNLSGAMLTEKYPSGRVMNYEYRADGELDKLSGTKAGQTSSFTYLDNISYNTLGNIEKMRLGNGTWETAEYNTRQQVSQIALGSSENTQNLLRIEYEYGDITQNNGSLQKQTINHTGLANEIVQQYTYDELNRLKSATETPAGSSTPSWKQTFNYDRYGNRTFDAANTTTLSGSSPTKVTNPTIQTSNNRLTENQDGGAIDYDYDANGNLTLDAENKRFVYDAENHIKEFFKGTNSGSTPDATYEYDGDGKRVRKVEETINGQVETIFVYNASGQLVAEYSNQMPTEPKASYLTADHLGSPRIATDGLGAVVSRHDYLAFGDEVTETIGNVGGRTTAQGYGEEDEIRQGYTGYERDDESGLDFAQARYYNSMHGRFTSVDPLTASANVKNPQTFNRYSYVLNSPYKFVDPLGLVSQDVACAQWCQGSDGSAGGGLASQYQAFENSGTPIGILLRSMQDNQQRSSSPSAPNQNVSQSQSDLSQEATSPSIQSPEDAANLEYQEYLDIPRPDFATTPTRTPPVIGIDRVSNGIYMSARTILTFTVFDQFGNPFAEGVATETVTSPSSNVITNKGTTPLNQDGQFNDFIDVGGQNLSTPSLQARQQAESSIENSPNVTAQIATITITSPNSPGTLKIVHKRVLTNYNPSTKRLLPERNGTRFIFIDDSLSFQRIY